MSRIELLFTYIVSYKSEHNGNSPSIGGMCQALGITSKSLLSHYLDKLIEDGRITKVDGKSRSIEVANSQWVFNG